MANNYKIPDGYNFKRVPGFDYYLIDIEKMVVYNMTCGRLRSFEGHRSISMATKRRPKKYVRVSIPKLVYASKMQIDYYSIPENFFIELKDGKTTVFEKADQFKYIKNARIRKAETNRIAEIDERIRELEILRNCYTTGDITEALKYIEEKSPVILERFHKLLQISKVRCYDYYADAFNIMSAKLRDPESALTNLTSNTYRIMIKQYRKHKRLQEFNPNIL